MYDSSLCSDQKKTKVKRCPKCALCVPDADLVDHVRRCSGPSADADSDTEGGDLTDLTRNEKR